MTLISGVLKGPYGDPRPGVTITMSTTDESGRYSLTVEPGAFEVIISVRGQADFSVGSIQVYADSQPGTLNDFLRRPGESDITPEIVQTVDRMRAEAAASAAAAKISEQNAADNVKPVVVSLPM
ncbi:prophage tail fiber N-terminal domain-containing protein [Vagococcus fluvialis]|uniref:prophage tail fiber N-terminal domain-containing protein n=1 Tax=Vagococcus fluvialis TaxID=2738 RepID=UPI003B5B16A2